LSKSGERKKGKHEVSFKLLSAILRGPWLIDANEARSYLPSVMNVLQGVTAYSDDREEEKPTMATMVLAGKSVPVVRGHWSMIGLKEEAHKLPQGSSVVVCVHGPITKADQYCGPVGSASIASFVDEISSMPNIANIILDIDSPGGQVDGTQTLANAVKNSPKRTVAYINDGMACSAAYWVASAADEIYVSQKTDVVGSIGVYVTLADFKGYYESLGLKIHEIYSNRSTEKNKEYKDALAGNYDQVRADLDFIADEFIAAVKANRPGINISAGNPFKGATYYADQAIEIGLIDGYASFDTIINSNNMDPEETTAAAPVKESAEAVTTETTATEITLDSLATRLAALSEEETAQLNTLLEGSALVVMSTETHQQAVDQVAQLQTQISSLQEFKTSTENWMKETGITHTSIEAKEDKFETTDDVDPLVAEEMAYAAQKLNELY
jgi:protease-4